MKLKDWADAMHEAARTFPFSARVFARVSSSPTMIRSARKCLQAQIKADPVRQSSSAARAKPTTFGRRSPRGSATATSRAAGRSPYPSARTASPKRNKRPAASGTCRLAPGRPGWQGIPPTRKRGSMRHETSQSIRVSGTYRSRALKPKDSGPAHGSFMAYEPGYLHIDITYLPQMADEDRRRDLFVAVERATRRVAVARLSRTGRGKRPPFPSRSGARGPDEDRPRADR
ncbi:hypothetical protein C8N38_1167 [Rhodovulum kholense]|uniref:Uncharacterized protein n=1 Tax=Rhodovulum kholense TaxID=453584 RepID=A0A8E2VGV4_9RHOB|nr:hypothetical protein C8N38_1167 [Rhodovulum kholense]